MDRFISTYDGFLKRGSVGKVEWFSVSLLGRDRFWLDTENELEQYFVLF